MDIVNSWNEWDPLQEVIVGSARGAADMGFEPALSPYLSPGMYHSRTVGQPVHAAVVEEAERQLDAFAMRLERLGIVVRRPDPVDSTLSIKTPDWEVGGGHAIACPRDACSSSAMKLSKPRWRSGRGISSSALIAACLRSIFERARGGQQRPNR